MKTEEIFQGPEVDLFMMMEARENRVWRQEEYLRQYGGTLLSINFNIPGPVKTSAILSQQFEALFQSIQDLFAEDRRLMVQSFDEVTGPSGFIVLAQNPREVKQIAVNFEEKHPLGRLLDLDVLWLEEARLVTLSRKDLGLKRRQCLICERDAKDCGRSRRHSVEDMQAEIANMLVAYMGE